MVDDLECTLGHALAAAARVQREMRAQAWSKIVLLADPFGHGFCLIEFAGGGCDEIAEPGQVRP